jgi:Spy/CpxP family protein refolding chaperone
MFFYHSRKTAMIAAMIALIGSSALGINTSASAQPGGFGGPPPGGFGGPGGGPGRGGPGGRGGFGGPRPVSVIGIPAAVLTKGLKLTAAQKTKIEGIQKQFQLQRERLMPRPLSEEGPTQQDFEKMRANGEKIRTLEQTASQKINATLTAPQKKALASLLKEAETMRMVGLPLELSYNLNLSAVQKSKIVALGQAAQKKREAARQSGNFRPGGDDREATHRQALAVLTAAQKKTVATYQQTHPRMGFGGPPGGFGGFGGRGPGGGGPPPPM